VSEEVTEGTDRGDGSLSSKSLRTKQL